MNKEISSKKDAYGQEVWAYLNGKKWYEVIERDDSFVDVSPGGEDYFQPLKAGPSTKERRLNL